MIWYAPLIARQAVPFRDVLSVFLNALRLDMAALAYIMVIPVFLLALQLFVRSKWWQKLNLIYTSIIIVIYNLIVFGEIGLYKEWNTKLSYKALIYLRQPDEVINSVSTWNLLIFLVLWVLISAIFIYLYIRMVQRPLKNLNRQSKIGIRIATIMLTFGLLFILMRGGINEIPITASDAYFSKHNILNIAAVNPGYNISFSILNHSNLKSLEPFFKLDDDEAERIVREMYEVQKDTTTNIIKYERPNIVFVLLESWPGDVIEALGGDKGITPEFGKLVKKGLLFTNFYASGNRSQQANASIFSGLPAIPITTLSDHPEKYASVPSLVKILNSHGYNTSFYFGGELTYGNLKSFLIYNEFDFMIEGKDLNNDYPRGKLGVHDEAVFMKFAEDIMQMKQPFFSTVFTLSSHAPYDYPGERPIDWIHIENKFVNSVHYTDRHLGKFFEKMKDSEIWENTLFFIMSDHSHLSYKEYPLWSFEYHQVPLLITGGALKDEYKGKTVGKICANMDIPATILKQLKLDADSFRWSRNMLNPYIQEFAFFELTDGFGWKRPYGELVKSAEYKWYYQKNAPTDSLPILEKEGYAYTQTLLKEFLGY